MRRNRVLRRIHFGRRATGTLRLRPDFVITQHPHEYFLVNWSPQLVGHPEVQKALPSFEMSSGSARSRAIATDECTRIFHLPHTLRSSWTVLSDFEEY